jgi:hypothetical protein
MQNFDDNLLINLNENKISRFILILFFFIKLRMHDNKKICFLLKKIYIDKKRKNYTSNCFSMEYKLFIFLTKNNFIIVN